MTNFTQWLAVHFSKVGIRVNAIAPGFITGICLPIDGGFSAYSGV